jgi:hypothetical protein
LLRLPGWRKDLETMISSFDIIWETDHEIASFQWFANLLSCWANVLYLALKLVFNFVLYVMYIKPHLHVIKRLLKFEILKHTKSSSKQ